MPYRNYGGPEDYYGQDSGFDPYTGRLNGGQLVMQFLQRLQAEKDRKKQEGWQAEDRQFQQEMRPLQMQAAQQGIQRGQQEISGYRPPLDPLVELLEGRNVTEKANKQREREITLRGEEERKTRAADQKTLNTAIAKSKADLNKQYLAAKTSVEKDYSTALKEIEKQFGAQLATLRKPNASGETQGTTATAEGSPYLRALQGAHASRKRARAELEARKAQQLDELERVYSQKLGEAGAVAQVVAQSQTPQYQEGDILTNPKTGEKVVLKNNEWVPIK